MWIGRKEFDALKAELIELRRRHESHVQDVVACRNFTLYEPKALAHQQLYTGAQGYGGYYSIPEQRILVKDVVQRILDKLDMQLVYVEGQPARVDVQQKPKASR